MRRRRGVAFLALFAVLGAAAPAFAADVLAPMVRVARLAPRVPAGATAIGRTASDLPLSITVVLQPSHPDALDQLVHDQYDPASPRYQQWLPTGEFAREFGPSPEVVDQVTEWLHAQGLAHTSVTNLAVEATGDAAAVGRALGVSFSDYHLAGGGTGFVASAAPLMPSST